MADNPTNGSSQDLTQWFRQSPFGVLLDIPGVDGPADIFDNVNFAGGSNPFVGGGAGFGNNLPSGGDPFAGDNFWNIFNGGVNPANLPGNAPGAGIPIGTNNPGVGIPIGINDPGAGIPIGINDPTNGAIPFPIGENSFARGDNSSIANQDSGSNNATIGTGNWDSSSYNATIGNGNWHLDEASYNSTIGNGNGLQDRASYNSTIGNGNWYGASSSENSLLGNGNWSFGSDNSTIGNGNWDFGNNNVVIGNGNWLFTDNNIVIGNGNWFLNDATGASQKAQDLATRFPDVKSEVDNLIAALTGKFGEEFTVLTDKLDPAASETFNQLILSQGNDTDFSTFSDSDLSNLFASLSGMSGINEAGGSPSCFFGCPNGSRPIASEPVPEPSSALSLLGVGLVYLVWAKKFKTKAKLNWKTSK